MNNGKLSTWLSVGNSSWLQGRASKKRNLFRTKLLNWRTWIPTPLIICLRPQHVDRRPVGWSIQQSDPQKVAFLGRPTVGVLSAANVSTKLILGCIEVYLILYRCSFYMVDNTMNPNPNPAQKVVNACTNPNRIQIRTWLTAKSKCMEPKHDENENYPSGALVHLGNAWYTFCHLFFSKHSLMTFSMHGYDWIQNLCWGCFQMLPDTGQPNQDHLDLYML